MKNNKYIPYIPKPLLDDFVKNKVVPFVGAGFSKNADIPDGIDMPDWNELGKLAASQLQNYKYDGNALDALSYYETIYSRPKLIELLMRGIDTNKVSPGATYLAFCELFTDTICTTNFDFLLERSFREMNRPISIISTEDRLSVLFDDETKLIKLHGDFNHPDRMVITEQDYDLYISKNPLMSTYISNMFITKTMLLVGYSLDDYDFRNLWQVVNSRLGKMSRPAYCILVNASDDKIAKFERRNIKVINIPGKTSDYKSILYNFFVELKDYIDKEKAKTIISTDDKINEQLIIPASENRLCYISCSTKRISQLKSIIYPALLSVGIMPIRIDDIIMPGDNWMDIARTTIIKSNIAIVDISDDNPNVMYELGLVQADKGNKNTIIVAEEGTAIPLSLSNHNILFYSFDVLKNDNNYKFQEALKSICNKIVNTELNNSLLSDAKRLLEKKEYSASVISALSELELHYNLQNDIRPYRRSLPNIIHDLAIQGICSNDLLRETQKYWGLRNNIIHKGYSANKNEAIKSIEFAESTIREHQRNM